MTSPRDAAVPAAGLPFVKMHGAANDFVVIDHREAFLGPDPGALVVVLCDRRRGIGADGVLLLERDPELDFAMRYFNADGGAADYCGNGARCLARFALDLGLGRGGRVRFRTAAGVQEAGRAGAGIDLRFGVVHGEPVEVEVAACGRTFRGRRVVAGVPHFVTEVSDLAAVPVAEWGRALRGHPEFGSAGANVDFVVPAGTAEVAMRTYERGVEGETLACGSGAIASALWRAAAGAPSPVRVRTAGGDVLEVGWTRVPAGYDVTLTGPAVAVYLGTWPGAAPGPGA